MGFPHFFSHVVDVFHVRVDVRELRVIVAHKHYGVLPVARVFVLHVCDGLVGHCASLFLCPDWEASDTDVHFVVDSRADALAVVEQCKPAVVDVARELADRVFTFVCQQEVVGRSQSPVAAEHAVVPSAVAIEQQVFRHVCLALGSVV